MPTHPPVEDHAIRHELSAFLRGDRPMLASTLQ